MGRFLHRYIRVRYCRRCYRKCELLTGCFVCAKCQRRLRAGEKSTRSKRRIVCRNCGQEREMEAGRTVCDVCQRKAAYMAERRRMGRERQPVLPPVVEDAAWREWAHYEWIVDELLGPVANIESTLSGRLWPEGD